MEGLIKVVITGGTGFIGTRLAQRIETLGGLQGRSGTKEAVHEIVLFDKHTPPNLPSFGSIVKIVDGDIADRDQVARLLSDENVSVFHLAAIVSAGAEQDFDAAMDVNLRGSLNVLEALRRHLSPPRCVFTSSIAAYGGAAMPKVIEDATRQVPQTTYGMTKAVGELLLNDYSRKGFVDGRGGRLGMVIVRPGKPNRAASSFGSSVIREPLNGLDYTLPVPAETRAPVIGYRTVVDGLIALHDLAPGALGDDRTINLPTISVSVADMIDSMTRVARGRTLGKITVQQDATTTRIVDGWPTDVQASRALELGLPKDSDLDSIIGAYIEDYVPRA